MTFLAPDSKNLHNTLKIESLPAWRHTHLTRFPHRIVDHDVTFLVSEPTNPRKGSCAQQGKIRYGLLGSSRDSTSECQPDTFDSIMAFTESQKPAELFVKAAPAGWQPTAGGGRCLLNRFLPDRTSHKKT